MWVKSNMMLVICIVGLFLVPNRLFACHDASQKPKQEEKSCCVDKGQKIADVNEKDCCQDASADSKKSHNLKDDCSKHCNQKSCRASSQWNPLVSLMETIHFVPLDSESVRTYADYKQPYYADAYSSIWQPPKIVK